MASARKVRDSGPQAWSERVTEKVECRYSTSGVLRHRCLVDDIGSKPSLRVCMSP